MLALCCLISVFGASLVLREDVSSIGLVQQEPQTTRTQTGVDVKQTQTRDDESDVESPDSPKVLHVTVLESDVRVPHGCTGHWKNWTKCNVQCFKFREFDGRCNGHLSSEKDFQLCHGDNCKTNFTALHAISTLDMHRMDAFAQAGARPFALVVVAVILVLGFLQKFELTWMPDAAVVTLVTTFFVMAVRFWHFGGVFFGDWADELLSCVVAPFMNSILLPITIFEGAFNMQRMNFWAEFGNGTAFAVLGTIASAFLIGSMIVVTGRWGWHPVRRWREALCFSAFIADVDPVATLSTFNKIRVDPQLSALVSGESMLNDPVAIVMFAVLNRGWGREEAVVADSLLAGTWLLTGSMLLGGGAGAVLTVLQKCAGLRGQATVEAIFLFSSAFALFGLGEMCGMSGIIVDLFGGLVMGTYARANLSEEGKLASQFVLHTTARTADVCIFMMLGLACFTLRWGNEPAETCSGEDCNYGWILGGLTIVFCLLARAVMLVVLIPILNIIKGIRGYAPITKGLAVMIWHSQLRGGLTLWMALMIDRSWTAHKALLLQATVVSVIGLMLLIGTTCPLMLRLTGVKVGCATEDGALFHESWWTRARESCHFGAVAWLVHSDSQHKWEVPGLSRWAVPGAVGQEQ